MTEYYIYDEYGHLDGPYSKKQADQILDNITWDEKLKFKLSGDEFHPYYKIMNIVQSKCNKIQVFRLRGTDLLCQLTQFLDTRNGLKVGYVGAYVDFYQPTRYCHPDDVESINQDQSKKRVAIPMVNFGQPKLVKWSNNA